MAKTSGYTCDGCGAFATSDSDLHLPDGWITVIPHATVPRGVARPEDRKADPPPASKHMCSNRCLAIFGLDRHEAETGKRLVRSNQRGVPKPRKQKITAA